MYNSENRLFYYSYASANRGRDGTLPWCMRHRSLNTNAVMSYDGVSWKRNGSRMVRRRCEGPVSEVVGVLGCVLWKRAYCLQHCLANCMSLIQPIESSLELSFCSAKP